MNVPKELEPLLFPVADLVELPGNPRRGDVDAVARSYEAFGQRKPIVVRRTDDGSNVVVAGNHQLAAARKLGWETIAVVWADDLSDDQAKAFALADNRTSDLGTYDHEDLLVSLSDVEDLSATGYNEQDLEDLRMFVAGPPNLDDLASLYDPDEAATGSDAGLVFVNIRVAPHVRDQWSEFAAGFDSEGEAFEALLDGP